MRAEMILKAASTDELLRLSSLSSDIASEHEAHRTLVPRNEDPTFQIGETEGFRVALDDDLRQDALLIHVKTFRERYLV